MASQQLQIAEGSLKSSHRNTHAIILKKAHKNQETKAINYLNNYCRDLVIGQRLNLDKNSEENIIKNNTFYVHTYLSKVEPGFLVFLPDNQPVFIRYNLSKKERFQTHGNPLCYVLRLRVSSVVNSGSVFVVSVDTLNHSMLFEDIYVWNNKNIFETETFTQRRNTMKEFVEKHWMPDVRLLGGIISDIIAPKPLSFVKTLENVKEYTNIHLIPETAGKRRFTFRLNETEAKLTDGFYGRKDIVVKPQAKNQEQPKLQQPPKTKHTVAKAVKIPDIPDLYELYDNEGNSLSRAAVQQLQLSKQLKSSSQNEVMVKVSFNEDFNRYEIVGLY
jgi:hypothetical protein